MNRAGTPLRVTLWWWTRIVMHLSPQDTHPRMTPDVHCGLWVTMTCHVGSSDVNNVLFWGGVLIVGRPCTWGAGGCWQSRCLPLDVAVCLELLRKNSLKTEQRTEGQAVPAFRKNNVFRSEMWVSLPPAFTPGAPLSSCVLTVCDAVLNPASPGGPQPRGQGTAVSGSRR